MILLSLFASLFLQLKPEIKTEVYRPNVLFVILDDVGYKDIQLVNTPTIDQIAQAGRNFTRGYAMPVCAQTRRTVMFAQYSENTGPICQDQPTWQTPSVNWFSLPKAFEGAGYNTAFFGKWHLGTNNAGLPWELSPQAHGFDSTYAIVPGNVNAICDGFEGDYYNWLAVDNGISYVETRYQTLVLRDKFMDWWSTARGPKFAVLSFQAAHAPFQEPPAEILPYLPQGGQGYTSNRIQFEKLVITADYVLSQIMSMIDLKYTYVVLIGDNGTPPNAIAPGMNSTKVKTTVYEGGIHVPLIIACPGITPGDSDSLVSIVDILPTLADLMNTTQPTPDGVSLVPVLKNPALDINDHVFASNDGNRAVVQERYKLIRLGNVEKFFDIIADPQENFPLNPASIDSVIVATLRKQMNYYIDRGL